MNALISFVHASVMKSVSVAIGHKSVWQDNEKNNHDAWIQRLSLCKNGCVQCVISFDIQLNQLVLNCTQFKRTY